MVAHTVELPFNVCMTAAALGDPDDPVWEYAPMRIAGDVPRSAATAQLSLHAEFGGWELARVQKYEDGSRRIVLRRKRRPSAIPLPQLPL